MRTTSSFANFSRKPHPSRRLFSLKALFLFCCLVVCLVGLSRPAAAQTEVTGGFIGYVKDRATGQPLAGVSVQFVNQKNGFETAVQSDAQGYFVQGNLQPGIYTVNVSLSGYAPQQIPRQVLIATRSNPFQPLSDVLLEREGAAQPTPTNGNPQPATTPTPPAGTTQTAAIEDEALGNSELGNSVSPRRDQVFTERSIVALPLGGSTLTRTFDELALLAPGVAPAPQAIGNTVGPGVGGGVGTSGQFSVNGLRSRANNFTVDGSDNNDEDIGVRRQGFFSLVPQPIESIQEFNIITLLAPAQFGRNLGAQVNALSKSGGNRFNGTIFSFFNSDRLNARNFFDYAGGNTTTPLQARQFANSSALVPVFVNNRLFNVTNSAGDKDSFTLFQGGAAVGGRIIENKLFFFASGEAQVLNAVQERHYAVPTVEQRGLFGSGATGLQQCQFPNVFFNGRCVNGNTGALASYASGFPTSGGGDAIFSLFPFPNDPAGVYGRNTYTQALSADARGRILSGRLDYNFKLFGGRAQTFTARYNYTDDRRDLADVGGALFSSIRPVTRTDNFSTFLTGSLSDDLSNVFRFSYGRTRLRFEELRDATGFIQPLGATSISSESDRRFLLSAQQIFNFTIPTNCTSTGCTAPSRVDYFTVSPSTGQSFGNTAQFNLGPVGQVNIAGFSPVGVDVFNFPQDRVNNTFQIADALNLPLGRHSLLFGADVRRTFLDSNLPRNSRPLVTFNGGPNAGLGCGSGLFCTPLDLTAAGAATGFFQTFAQAGSDARINLGYYQLNFFAQDEWRVAPELTLSLGLRYEMNTVPKEADNKIESTFASSQLNLVPGLSQFIDGRRRIYDSDRNNFAPRFGFATALTQKTVVRGGAGIYYDQIIGAVVSQSRNVFPTFTTVNFGGGAPTCYSNANLTTVVNCTTPGAVPLLLFSLFNPLTTSIGTTPIVRPGTLNTLNPNLNLADFLAIIRANFPGGSQFFTFPNGASGSVRGAGSAIGATLPDRQLETPFAFQYSLGVEQEVFRDTFFSAAYVGTSGRKLLRFSTPNLGGNYIAAVTDVFLGSNGSPAVFGLTLDPTLDPSRRVFAGRPVPSVGPINQFETAGRSQYHSLQLQMRGRLARALQYQFNYTLSKAEDDASDVFDLAGASALAQNSITREGEYAASNFDVRHRFAYSFIYDLPQLADSSGAVRFLLGGWQIAGTGKFNTGQPFTVNSIFDANFDGNLNDRLNNTRFIEETGDRRQPLRLTSTSVSNLQSMLNVSIQNGLFVFGDGAVPRNSFRAGNLLELDLSLNKRFAVTERQNLQFRVDFFNFINRHNFGIPVRFLEAPNFGQAVDTVTPGRRIQFALKYNF